VSSELGSIAVAFPILKALGVPATIFLTTDFVEHGTALWTDRVDYCLETGPAAQITVDVDGAPIDLDLTTVPGRLAALAILHARLTCADPTSQLAAAALLEHATGRALGSRETRPDVLQPLSWAEIEAMRASGLVTFGSHTCTHAILSRCEPARQRREIDESRTLLEHRLGVPCDLFCYPNGRREDFDAATRSVLRELGFRAALTTIAGTNGLTRDPFEIRRFIVSAREDFRGFVLKMYGVVNALSDAKRRLLGRRG
jgi:peptidoglycan/xylan/chitin deacetylase (PgdA/CDA1 family)